MSRLAARLKHHSPSSIAAAVFVGVVLAIPVAFASLILLFSRPAVLYVASPVLVGVVVTALTRMRWPKNGPWMVGLGILIPCGVMLQAWLTSPLSSAPYNGCSDCANYLGHWWEPWFALFFGIIGYGLWLVGVGLGVAAVAALGAARRRLPERPVATGVGDETPRSAATAKGRRDV